MKGSSGKRKPPIFNMKKFKSFRDANDEMDGIIDMFNMPEENSEKQSNCTEFQADICALKDGINIIELTNEEEATGEQKITKCVNQKPYVTVH